MHFTCQKLAVKYKLDKYLLEVDEYGFRFNWKNSFNYRVN